jgi:hypothetical protein
MTPKKITFKIWPHGFGQKREQFLTARWLANHYGCYYGRGGFITSWNFIRITPELFRETT